MKKKDRFIIINKLENKLICIAVLICITAPIFIFLIPLCNYHTYLENEIAKNNWLYNWSDVD